MYTCEARCSKLLRMASMSPLLTSSPLSRFCKEFNTVHNVVAKYWGAIPISCVQGQMTVYKYWCVWSDWPAMTDWPAMNDWPAMTDWPAMNLMQWWSFVRPPGAEYSGVCAALQRWNLPLLTTSATAQAAYDVKCKQQNSKTPPYLQISRWGEKVYSFSSL